MRFLFFVMVAAGGLGFTPGMAAQAPAPMPAPIKKSRVVQIERPNVVQKFVADGPSVEEMFTQALLKLTGQSSPAQAWKSLGISSADTVGIKISTAGGQLLATHRPLLEAILQGLMAAGVSPAKLVVWDKFEEDMIAAGYPPVAGAPKKPSFAAVIPGVGFDPEAFYVNEIVGKLIWGDFQFVGKRPTAQDLFKAAEEVARRKEAEKAGEMPEPDAPTAEDQTSNKSFYTKLVTQVCTKIIHVPVLVDHPNLGLSGCISSLAIGSVDNTRRFNGEGIAGDPAVAEILDKDFMKKKVVLHVLDALVAQYAGGPKFRPQFTQSIGALYLSTDPVAVDSLVLKRMEQWRRDGQVVAMGDLAKHVAGAAEYGLGNSDPNKIDLVILP
jgi:hypothetical protein